MSRNGLMMFHTSRIENSTVLESQCWRMSARDHIGPSRQGMRWAVWVLEGVEWVLIRRLQ